MFHIVIAVSVDQLVLVAACGHYRLRQDTWSAQLAVPPWQLPTWWLPESGWSGVHGDPLFACMQARAIEERRRRMAAIKAKHQAALAETEPTATAHAAARDADAAQAADAALQSADATPAASGMQETPERPAEQLTPDRPGVCGAHEVNCFNFRLQKSGLACTR